MKFTRKQVPFVEAARALGYGPEFADKQIINEKTGHSFDVVNREIIGEIHDTMPEGSKLPWWLTIEPEFRVGHGLYRIPSEGEDLAKIKAAIKARKSGGKKAKAAPTPSSVVAAPSAVPESKSAPEKVALAKASGMIESAVPSIFKNYKPFGHFNDVLKILKSEMFYPFFITGLSGNGKTLMVEQASAKANRELFRVNITIETDEDDLLGGFRLVDGETVWFDGPVVEALRRGAVLLLDEVDLASNKIMCLQPVLEGKGIFLKKINEWVEPAPGFNIAATANTKGKGDEAGRFIGTNVLNDAFLERFPITFEQDYPSVAVEKKILLAELNDVSDEKDPDFVGKLVDWADMIRKTFREGGVDELITTRRLVHIIKAFGIFGDRGKAINLALNRFDDETKESFMDFYSKIDEKIEAEKAAKAAAEAGTLGTPDAPPETGKASNDKDQSNYVAF